MPEIPTITGFRDSPDRGKGHARDMRVRWALEEVGQPYRRRLLTFEQLKEAPHRALQPFGQIPTFELGDLVLFESGAIVLHIAERYEGLLPADDNARARAKTWMFAALNTMELPILEYETARLVERNEPWFEARLPLLQERVRKRLGELADRLADGQWLEGSFTAGDLMMVSVLRRIEGLELLEEHANLVAYVERARERPAFQRAFAAQLL